MPREVGWEIQECNPYDFEVDERDYDMALERRKTEVHLDEENHGTIKANQKKILSLRLCIAFLAIGLLWMTTLSIAHAFVNIALNPPAAKDVQWDIYQLADAAKASSYAYERNVNLNLLRCNRSLVRDLEDLKADHEELELENADNIYGLSLAYNHCEALNIEIDILRNWRQRLINMTHNKSYFRRHYTPQCTAADMTFLERFLDYGDTSEAMNACEEHTEAQQTMFGFASQRAAENANYTGHYMAEKAGNLTNFLIDRVGGVPNISVPVPENVKVFFDESFDGALACVTLDTTLCTDAANTKQTIDDAYDMADKSMAAMEREINRNAAKLREMETGFYELRDDVIVPMGDALAKAEKVIETYSSLFAGGNMPNIPSIHLPDFPGTDAFGFDPDEFPSIDLDLSNINLDGVSGIAADAAKNTMGTLDTVMTNTAERSQQFVSDRVDQYADSINDMVSIDTGYDPPPVDLNTSMINHTKTLDEARATLAKISVAASDVEDAIFNFTKSFTNASLPDLAFSTSFFQYEPVQSKVDISVWDVIYEIVKWACWSIDWIFRVYWSARIFIRYWYGSAVELPVMDIRQFKTTQHKSYPEKMFALATHPLVMFGGVIFIGTLIAITVTALYVPMLQSYVGGCVESRDGTFLSHNTYALVFNGAAYLGNKETGTAVKNLDIYRASECAKTIGKTQSILTEQEEMWSGIEQKYSKMFDVRTKIEECFEPDIWEDEYMAAMFPALTVSQRVQLANMDLGNIQAFDLNKILSISPECQMDKVVNVSQAYDHNCSTVDVCVMDTNLTNQATLEMMSHKTVCHGEWYLHSLLMSSVCTVVVYIIWNMCRSFLLTGITIVFWKELSPKGFEYMGTCDREGNCLEDSEYLLAKTIVKNTTEFERKSKLYLVLAVVPNVLYFALLIYTRNLITLPM